MNLVAEVITPSEDDVEDVVTAAEEILLRALFDDIVSTLTTSASQVGVALSPSPFRTHQSALHDDRQASRSQGTVFPWERSPPEG